MILMEGKGHPSSLQTTLGICANTHVELEATLNLCCLTECEPLAPAVDKSSPENP